jgi:oligogalacturonide lyase
MFGASYVFAVEVEKAAPGAADLESTPELAAKYAPAPTSTPADK